MTQKIISGGSSASSDSSGASVSAFGETSIAPNTPVFGSDAVYGIVDQLAKADSHSGGTASASGGMFVCQSGSSAQGEAYIQSDHPLTYHPGVGSMCRFTAMFEVPSVTTSQQLAGLSNVENFLQVGYRESTTFGVHFGTGGTTQVHKFTVTTGASVGESITITLDGETKAVTVTANNDTAETAWEIGSADYSATGSGWKAYAEGAIVYFISERAEDLDGTYSLSGETGDLAITIAEEIAGSAPTVTSVTAFDVDPLDGTGSSGMTIDPTKLNVYQIQYQYLGAGDIEFFIENPETGKLTLFHRFQYANANTTPHLANPTMFFRLEAYNGTGTDDVTCKSASFGGFHQGAENQLGPRYGADFTKATIGTTFVPILSLKGSALFGSRASLAESHIERLGFSCDGTKGAVVAIIRDGTLDNAANFSLMDASSATMVDTDATTITGGHDMMELGVATGTNLTIGDLDQTLTFDRDEIITIAAKSTSSTTDVTATVVVHEEI